MKHSIFFSAILFLFVSLKAQDLAFINTNQSLVNLNPSFAGSNGLIRNQLSYRNQWPKLSSNYIWYGNNFDAYLKGIRAGIALTGQWAFYGDLVTTTSYGLTYAQHLQFLDGSIKIIPSIQALYRFSNFNGRYFPSTRTTYVDLNSGLLFSYKERLYLGGSVFHLAEEPGTGFYTGRDARKFTFHGSYSIDIGEKHLVQFMFLHNRQRSHYYSNVMVNAIFNKHFLAGVGYGSGENINATAGYRATWFSIAYAYGLSVSRLAGNINGLHELHFSYNIRGKEHKKALTGFETF